LTRLRMFHAAKVSSVVCQIRGDVASCTPIWEISPRYGELVRAMFAGSPQALKKFGESDLVEGQEISVKLNSVGGVNWSPLPAPSQWMGAWISDKIAANLLSKSLRKIGAEKKITVSSAEFSQDGVILSAPDVDVGVSQDFEVGPVLAGPKEVRALRKLFYETSGLLVQVDSVSITGTMLQVKGKFLWPL